MLESLDKLLDGLRNVGNLHEFAELFGFDWYDENDWTWHDVAVKMADDVEQAIAATLGSEREKALEELVRDMSAALIHNNCYRWCEAKEPCNLITDGKCQYRERIRELGIEVVADER